MLAISVVATTRRAFLTCARSRYRSSVQIELITRAPSALFLVELGLRGKDPLSLWFPIAQGIESANIGVSWTEFAGSTYRAVRIGALDRVMATGIDVEPSDHHFYAADWQKAWEYGAWPKLLLVLDPQHIRPTLIRVRDELTESEAHELEISYPIAETDKSGRSWRRRASTRFADQDEIDYGRWIPGEARRALRLALVAVTPDSLDAGRAAVSRWRS